MEKNMTIHLFYRETNRTLISTKTDLEHDIKTLN